MEIIRVEFILSRSEIRNRRIHIQDIRRIFPPDEVEFILHTDDDGTEGPYPVTIHANNEVVDHFHLGKWFDNRFSSIIGNKLTLEVIKPMKEYSLK